MNNMMRCIAENLSAPCNKRTCSLGSTKVLPCLSFVLFWLDKIIHFDDAPAGRFFRSKCALALSPRELSHAQNIIGEFKVSFLSNGSKCNFLFVLFLFCFSLLFAFVKLILTF